MMKTIWLVLRKVPGWVGALLLALERTIPRLLQGVWSLLFGKSPDVVPPPPHPPTPADAERTALVRGTILVTHLFLALSLGVLLVGHIPLPPDDPLPADFSEQAEVSAADTARLNAYGWVDREAEVVHIPIREAMRLTVSEGSTVGREARMVEQGQALFHGAASVEDANFRPCTTCHYLQADRGVLVGPNMAGVADRAGSRVPGLSAENYVRQSIVSHDAFVVEGFEEGVMLGIVGEDFGEMLSEEDIDALVAYLLTLHEGDAASQPPPTPPARLAATTAPEPETPQEIAIGVGEAVVPDANRGVTLEEEGYAFHLPAGWRARSFGGKLAVRPEGGGGPGGPVIAMKAGTLSDLNIPNVSTTALTVTDEFFRVISETVRQETANVVLDEVASLRIGAAPGWVATLRGSGFGDIEGEVFGRFAVALGDQSRVFVMMGLASPPAAWDADPVFGAMLRSVRFVPSPPPPAPAAGTNGASGGGNHPDARDDILGDIFAETSPGASPEPMPHAPRTLDRGKGPRFSCVHCHVTHDVEMRHDSNPSCATCHSGTSYQRHCVDCHSIHGVRIPHRPQNPSCANCHPQGIPGGEEVDMELALMAFLSYLFHEI
jgi:cytochrome c